jgi:hypothetical protein
LVKDSNKQKNTTKNNKEKKRAIKEPLNENLKGRKKGCKASLKRPRNSFKQKKERQPFRIAQPRGLSPFFLTQS